MANQEGAEILTDDERDRRENCLKELQEEMSVARQDVVTLENELRILKNNVSVKDMKEKIKLLEEEVCINKNEKCGFVMNYF